MTIAQKAILENAHDIASFEYKYWSLWPRRQICFPGSDSLSRTDILRWPL